MSTRFSIIGIIMFAPPGSAIEAAVDAAIDYAKQHGCQVRFDFNGIRVNVNPNSAPAKVVRSQQHRQWVKSGSNPA